MAGGLRFWLEFELTAASCLLWTLPMFHCNGWSMTWGATAVGATHVCLGSFDPQRALDLAGRYPISHLCGAPVVLRARRLLTRWFDLGRRFGVLGCKESDQVCRCGEPGGRGCDGVSVFFQERPDFADGLGDPAAVHGEQFGQDCLCARSAQVKQGGQGPVGVGELGTRACSGRAAALGAAPLVPGLLAPCLLRSGKFSDQIVQLLAGHARQRRM
jgi:acyl-CoA synthetase (AMP-forming)/AMP-acid ligase II